MCFWRYSSIIMTWNKWLVFTEISYYVIEQHIKLTLPVWRCLITVSIIWPYLTPPLDMQIFGVEVCLSLHVPYDPGSIPTSNFVVLVIFFLLLQCFVFFVLFLPQWLIFLFFFHIDILIKTSSLNLTNLCVVPKIVMHVEIGDICLSCY